MYATATTPSFGGMSWRFFFCAGRAMPWMVGSTTRTYLPGRSRSGTGRETLKPPAFAVLRRMSTAFDSSEPGFRVTSSEASWLVLPPRTTLPCERLCFQATSKAALVTEKAPNVAEADVGVFRVTAQVGSAPEQGPPQARRDEPAPGAAVSVTEVPQEKSASHVAPHVMPPGALVTVPLPLFVTVSLTGRAEKVAVTDRWVVIETLQPPVPLHAPLQPSNFAPSAGDALTPTDV